MIFSPVNVGYQSAKESKKNMHIFSIKETKEQQIFLIKDLYQITLKKVTKITSN